MLQRQRHSSGTWRDWVAGHPESAVVILSGAKDRIIDAVILSAAKDRCTWRGFTAMGCRAWRPGNGPLAALTSITGRFTLFVYRIAHTPRQGGAMATQVQTKRPISEKL